MLESLWLGAMHPPSRCALLCGESKSQRPSAWLIHQLGLVSPMVGRVPAADLWHALWASVCGLFQSLVSTKIGGMASHRSREGGHHVWLVTGPGVLSCTTWEGLYFRSLVAATRGKARSHCVGSPSTIFAS
ncbi:hypothetical protein VNO80_34416 [Phaseolus coccineus]|uniref:Uncharacterized protein n=1 Tax=Phaseolus coccineus TaxID=3886 RepID=A0AAN9KXK4_PHACN